MNVEQTALVDTVLQPGVLIRAELLEEPTATLVLSEDRAVLEQIHQLFA